MCNSNSQCIYSFSFRYIYKSNLSDSSEAFLSLSLPFQHIHTTNCTQLSLSRKHPGALIYCNNEEMMAKRTVPDTTPTLSNALSTHPRKPRNPGFLRVFGSAYVAGSGTGAHGSCVGGRRRGTRQGID